MSKDRFFSGGGQSEIDALKSDVNVVKSELNSRVLICSGTPTTANTWQTFNLASGYKISDFRFIVCLLAQYSNTFGSIIEPRELFESHQSSGNRVVLNYTEYTVQIYRQSDTSINVYQNNLASGFGFKVYGIL